jgi:hypothetical protein
MTPKEEAEKLVGMFERQITKGDVDGEWLTEHLIKYFHYTAKQCALIAVNRIMKAGIHFLDLLYWQEVKKELENL